MQDLLQGLQGDVRPHQRPKHSTDQGPAGLILVTKKGL